MKLTMVIHSTGMISHYKSRQRMYIIKMLMDDNEYEYSEYMTTFNDSRIRKWL